MTEAGNQWWRFVLLGTRFVKAKEPLDDSFGSLAQSLRERVEAERNAYATQDRAIE